MSDIQIHFGYSVTSKLNQLTSNFKTYQCQTSSRNFGIGCPHSLEMELDVQFKTFQKWMSDILGVTLRKWMSAISKMDVTFQKWMSHISKMDVRHFGCLMSKMDVRHFGCHIWTMDVRHFKNGCHISKMDVKHFKNGCQTFWMSHVENGCQTSN